MALPGRLPPLPLGLGELSSRWWALVPAALDRRRDRRGQLLRGLGDLPHLSGAGRRAAAGRGRPRPARARRAARPGRWRRCRSSRSPGRRSARSPARPRRRRSPGSPASPSAGCWSRSCPALWLRWGIYAMAAIDAWLVAADLLQGPNSVLSAAAPGRRPAAPAGGPLRLGPDGLRRPLRRRPGRLPARSLRRSGRKRRRGAGFRPVGSWLRGRLVAVLALGFDLFFFAVDSCRRRCRSRSRWRSCSGARSGARSGLIAAATASGLVLRREAEGVVDRDQLAVLEGAAA